MALTLKKLRLQKVATFLLQRIGLKPKPVPKDPAFQLGSAYGIDRLLIIGGFGAIASGWLLAPGRHVVSMSLSAGGQMLDNDRRCLLRGPRSDLAASFPDYADATGTAGFQCVFRGPAPDRPAGPYALRIHLEDGTAPYLKVPESVVRVCDGTDELKTLAHYFPALANEPFLDDFARAYAATAKRRAAKVVTLLNTPVRRAAILMLPDGGDDLALAAARILRASHRFPADVGLALLVSAQHPHARLLDRVADLRTRMNRPVSLFELSDPTYALWSLTPILAALGAERFWFCGPEVVPTDAGWARAADVLAQDGGDLEFFAGPSYAADAEPESLCFAWCAGPFNNWIAKAPFFLSGFHRDNHLPPSLVLRRTYGAIGLLRTMIAAEPLRRADECLYQRVAAHNNHEASS